MAPGAIETVPKNTNAVANRKLGDESSHDIVLKSFRLLVADLCQQFNGGHPG